jgi:RNA polymerase I-specific transcription initiation factor RRN6
MRLDVRSQVKSVVPTPFFPPYYTISFNTTHRTDDGTIIAMYYKGTVALSEGVKAVLSGSADAKTTEFGDSFVTFTFETGNDKYKELQNGVYVAAGRFVVEKTGNVVEYRVGKVGI